MNDRSERRRHPRVPVDAEARVRVAGSEEEGTLCRLADGSLGGVSIRAEEPPASDRVLVEILTVDGEPVSEPLEARVVYVDADPDGGYRVGCRFELFGDSPGPGD